MKKVSTSSILHNLNPEQTIAVTVTDKPVLVLAGAGSGKTRIVTYKIAYLIEKGIPPHKILAITFTRKAAEEMKKRVFSLVGIESKWISTFHSFCLKVLREHFRVLNNGLKASFVVYDESDSIKMFREVCKKCGYSGDFENLYKKISKLKQYSKFDPRKLSYEELKIWEYYEEELIKSNAVDFDNIQRFAHEILSIPRISSLYKSSFDYILVDEFQDTSEIQYSILKKIISKNNVTVVGDPQQSIYGFRGAEVRNTIKFIEEYQPYEVKLSENYRSCRSILDLANTVAQLVGPEFRRLVVNLKAFKKVPGKVECNCYLTDYLEAKAIAEKIKVLTEGIYQYQPKDIVVLVRSRYVLEPIKQVFSIFKIPFDDLTAYDLFKREEVRDVLAYLRFAYNPLDLVSFQRALTRPKRGVGEQTIQQIKLINSNNYLQALKFFISRNKQTRKSTILSDFIRIVEYVKQLLHIGKLQEAFDFIIKTTKYVEYISKDKDTFEEKLNNLKELRNILGEYNSFEDFLEEFISNYNRTERNAVKLMTIHMAKGLEFDVVFLPAVETNIFPDNRAENGFDEELRCFYVGITRAKDRLYISSSQRRAIEGIYTQTGPSPFCLVAMQSIKTEMRYIECSSLK